MLGVDMQSDDLQCITLITLRLMVIPLYKDIEDIIGESKIFLTLRV